MSGQLYGVEGWTLKMVIVSTLEASEMWIYRRVLEILWTARVTNENIPRKINRDRELLTIIRKRKLHISDTEISRKNM